MISSRGRESGFWENTASELLSVATSPIHASWSGYVITTAFGAAAITAMNQETGWYGEVHNQRTEWQDKTMPVLTLMGDGFVQAAGLAVLYQYGGERDRRAAAMALEGQVNVAVVAYLLKQVFSASRPDEAPRRWFTGKFGDTSFPSGHTMSAFATAVILGDAYQAEWVAYPLAAMVAYSRIYNRAHWPLDVIAGAGLGVLIGRTVLAHHAFPLIPGGKISAIPRDEGGVLVVTWTY